MSRRRLIQIVIPAVLLAAVGTAVKFGRHHVFPKRFVEVVPGELYRSGYLQEGPLRRVLDEYRIRTVLALLNDEPDNPEQQQEDAILAEQGVRLVRISGMRGDGVADFDQLDRAAEILADESMHPLLVHCAAGVNRTGAVYAAWRMKYCGWDPERAIAEAEDCGYSPRDNPQLRSHLLEYYRLRIAASRPAG